MIREQRPSFPGLPVVRMCQLLKVSRSLLYRKPSEHPERDEFLRGLRKEIEAVVGYFTGYGYRRVTKELMRRGLVVGKKRVLSVMRKEGLLHGRRGKTVRTTHADPVLPVYANLLRGRQADAPNQVWVADMTFIRLGSGWQYLSVVLDAFTRRVVGWRLSDRMDVSLPLGALDEALRTRQPGAGWIHHSDRGSQYASHTYVQRVTESGGVMSMSRSGRPGDNPVMESFYKTLKMEEVYTTEYESTMDANHSLRHYIETVYNRERLHSSLGYLTPDEFERASLAVRDEA